MAQVHFLVIVEKYTSFFLKYLIQQLLLCGLDLQTLSINYSHFQLFPFHIPCFRWLWLLHELSSKLFGANLCNCRNNRMFFSRFVCNDTCKMHQHCAIVHFLVSCCFRFTRSWYCLEWIYMMGWLPYYGLQNGFSSTKEDHNASQLKT